jgi:hypothetical protein
MLTFCNLSSGGGHKTMTTQEPDPQDRRETAAPVAWRGIARVAVRRWARLVRGAARWCSGPTRKPHRRSPRRRLSGYARAQSPRAPRPSPLPCRTLADFRHLTEVVHRMWGRMSPDTH